MANFQDSKVYKLVNSVDDEIYIGSTCQTLTKKKYFHKKNSTRHPNRRVYEHLNRIGWENVRIILIESVQAFNKDQLRAREQHYIDLLRPSLNKYSAMDTCNHGRQQKLCKQCHGSSICQHNRQRNKCKECGGVGICQHNRQRNKCKECHGSGICQHNRRKNTCKECNPDHICFECNKNFSSSLYLTKHCRTARHKKKCKDLFKEIFDYELLDSEIPMY
jgi:hypothetical protein